MTSIVSFLLSSLLLYKYAALFVISFLAAIIVPLPVTEVMLGIGAFVGQGYFNFWGSLAAAHIANVLGDLADYAFARRYGSGIVHKVRLDRSRFFAKIEQEMQTHARSTIFITRFAGELGPLVNFLSGAAGIPIKKFLIFDFAGNLAYYVGILLIGLWAGNYWENFSELMSLLISIFVVLIIIKWLWHIYRRFRNNRKERKKAAL
ncbi:DedA family protein [Patescibacteria group bacterium]|jgi:undecaprenyl-diphosphatase|nr:DedA family protein [Patescibacteria group bacterium]MCL5114737.1 DedA family protein [Patescibacteria group bacterium]